MLPAAYVFLAAQADANDRAVAEHGELPPGQAPPPMPDDGRSYAPHYRDDLDRWLGLIGDEEIDTEIAAGEDTNVVDLADWIRRANDAFDR